MEDKPKFINIKAELSKAVFDAVNWVIIDHAWIEFQKTGLPKDQAKEWCWNWMKPILNDVWKIKPPLV